MLLKALALLGRPQPDRGGCALLVAAALAATAAPRPASAGFFDFLFNPKAQNWNPFAPTPEQVQPGQRAAPVVRNKKPHRLATRSLRHLERAKPTSWPLASRDFMDDRSLRGGDAVMTPNGIRIFTGPPGERHSPENFAGLDEIKGLGKQTRSALAALDAHFSRVTRAEAKPSLATGRSTAGQITAGSLIIDPKGRKIRYVGP